MVIVEQKFIEQINNHIGILHKICNTYFLNDPNREDYYQEILIRLWKAYPNFKNQSAFSTWMYRVALNSAIDIIRKISSNPQFVEITSCELSIPSSKAQHVMDERERLYQAINRLNINEKAITLLYLDDYSYDEIASVVGISKSNVGVKINRIKKELIKIMNGHERK